MIQDSIAQVSARRNNPYSLKVKDDELGYATQNLIPYKSSEDWYLIYNNVSYSRQTGLDIYKKVMAGEFPKDSTMIASAQLKEEYEQLQKQKESKKWLLLSLVLIPLTGLLAYLLTNL